METKKEIILLTYWDSVNCGYSYKWFNTKEKMDEYISKNEIEKFDINDKIKILDYVELT